MHADQARIDQTGRRVENQLKTVNDRDTSTNQPVYCWCSQVDSEQAQRPTSESSWPETTVEPAELGEMAKHGETTRDHLIMQPLAHCVRITYGDQNR